MHEKTKRLKTRFGPPARFAVQPGPTPNPTVIPDRVLETLKLRLLAERTITTRALVPGEALRRAADEAVSLAWLTSFPLLVLPTLFDELVDGAAARTRRQADIRQRSQMLQAA